MIEAEFKAMNSTIKLLGIEPAMQCKLKELFSQFEQKASRFIRNNELEYMNKSPLHVPVHVDETLADLLEKSLQLSRKVDYYVHPFIGDAMKSIGYNHSFHLEYIPTFEKNDSWTEDFFEEPIEQLTSRWIIKKRHFSFDFGGFGKGYIVDQARKLLVQENINNALINAGGDLTAIGKHQVGIEHPMLIGTDIMKLYIENHAMATSGKHYRKWRDGHNFVHHIVNGQTGKVANNHVVQASVIAKTVMEAETIAKIFCILPLVQAKALIYEKFPKTAYFLYLINDQMIVGGDATLYEKLEVAT